MARQRRPPANNLADSTEPPPVDTPDTPPETDYINLCIQVIQDLQADRLSHEHSGRTTVFTPRAIRKLLEALERGNYYEPACHYAGVSYRSFRRWMSEGEKDETETSAAWTLWQAVKTAEAIWENAALGRLEVAAQTPRFYMADIIRLSRRHRERWADTPPQTNVIIPVQIGQPGAPVLIEPRQPALSPPLSRDLHRLTVAGTGSDVV